MKNSNNQKQELTAYSLSRRSLSAKPGSRWRQLRDTSGQLTTYLIFVFCLLNLLGCATVFTTGKSSSLLEPQANLKFSDVPVPVGLKLIPEESYLFENAGMRAGVLKYRGKAQPDQIINFFKEQMPLYNWNLLNIVEYGQRQMNFDRDNDTCIITLWPKGRSTTLVISVGPKSPSAKKAEKPIK